MLTFSLRFSLRSFVFFSPFSRAFRTFGTSSAAPDCDDDDGEDATLGGNPEGGAGSLGALAL
jgi:hypothetical protein